MATVQAGCNYTKRYAKHMPLSAVQICRTTLSNFSQSCGAAWRLHITAYHTNLALLDSQARSCARTARFRIRRTVVAVSRDLPTHTPRYAALLSHCSASV